METTTSQKLSYCSALHIAYRIALSTHQGYCWLRLVNVDSRAKRTSPIPGTSPLITGAFEFSPGNCSIPVSPVREFRTQAMRSIIQPLSREGATRVSSKLQLRLIRAIRAINHRIRFARPMVAAVNLVSRENKH